MADDKKPPHRPSEALYERLARDAARLLVMHEAGRVLRSTHDPQELSRELLQAIAEAIFCRSGCVARLRNNELEILATLGFDEAGAEALSQNEAEAGVWFHVADSEQPISRDELIAMGLGADADSSSDDSVGEDVEEAVEEAMGGAVEEAVEVKFDDGQEAGADDDSWTPPDDDDWQPPSDDDDEDEGPRLPPLFDVYVPLRLEERQIGVLALGQRADGEPFSAADRDLALSLSSQLALALNSSELFEDKEQRIEQLSVLLRLSKELTSTLEIDKVLGTVCGMLRLIVPNRRTVVALVTGEAVKIRASSAEDFDAKKAVGDPLLPVFLWAHGAHQEVNTSLQELEGDDAAEGRNVLLPLLSTAGGPRGLTIRALRDDEGVLGYLAIEADADDPPVDEGTDELLTILINQTSVAIRNADLYQRIPMLGVFSGRKSGSEKANRRKWIKRGIWAAVFAVGLFIPIPSWISGDAVVRPTLVVPVRAATEGTVEIIEIAEGEVVAPGQRLAGMRRDELSVALEQNSAASRRAQAEAGAARQSGNLAIYQARQVDLVRLDEERRFLETEMTRKDVLAPMAGVVLTSHVELLQGKHLARGETFIEMADLAAMEIEVAVPEQEIVHAQVGAEARFKVQAYPGRVFRGEVVRVAPRTDGLGDFRVAVQVPNPDGSLRPGMTGRAHIDTPPRPFLYKPLRPLLTWFRIKFWV